MPKKILFIGRASVGKTSIKKIIFEGENSKDLIIHPLKPTRGITSSIYSWMDLELVLFDTSGQELPFLLEDEKKQNKAFYKADVIIYVFDYPTWASNSQEIKDEIKEIENLISRNYIEAKFLLFFHKIDLINKKYREKLKLLKNQIQEILNLPEIKKIYFTSIHPLFIYNTYNAFSEIFCGFLGETSDLKHILDNTVKDFPKTMGFITGKNNSIIVQTEINDFDINLINQLHTKILEINQSTEDKTLISKKINYIDSGSKILSVIIDNLNHFNANFKNLIIFSENFSKENLNLLIEKLEIEFNKYYNKK